MVTRMPSRISTRAPSEVGSTGPPEDEASVDVPKRRDLVVIADRGGDAADAALALQLGEGAADRPIRPAETHREGAVARCRLRRPGGLFQSREDLILNAVASAAGVCVGMQLRLCVCRLLALGRRNAI